MKSLKDNQGNIFIIIGIMLLLVALSIVLYNINEDLDGNDYSNSVVLEIKSKLPDISYAEDTSNKKDVQTPSLEEEIINQYEDNYEDSSTDTEENIIVEQPLLYINGDYYLGIITIPSLNLELPILSNLTNKNLKKSPCLYSGSIQTGDLIIAGHNYTSHFGYLQNLNTDDEIYITDINGVVYQYEVIQSEVINGYDVQSMKKDAENWDLTLFTCTLSGKSRITIRAIQVF